MEVKKVEIIDPYNTAQLELLNDFCLRNDIENVAKKLQEQAQSKDQVTYLKDKSINPIVEDYIAIIANDKITDYCYFHGEKDIRQAFLSFPQVLRKKHVKNRPIIQVAVDYAFSLGMEEIFVTSINEDISLQNSLEEMGFISLGSDDYQTPFVLTKEETKDKVIA